MFHVYWTSSYDGRPTTVRVGNRERAHALAIDLSEHGGLEVMVYSEDESDCVLYHNGEAVLEGTKAYVLGELGAA